MKKGGLTLLILSMQKTYATPGLDHQHIKTFTQVIYSLCRQSMCGQTKEEVHSALPKPTELPT